MLRFSVCNSKYKTSQPVFYRSCFMLKKHFPKCYIKDNFSCCTVYSIIQPGYKTPFSFTQCQHWNPLGIPQIVWLKSYVRLEVAVFCILPLNVSLMKLCISNKLSTLFISYFFKPQRYFHPRVLFFPFQNQIYVARPRPNFR